MRYFIQNNSLLSVHREYSSFQSDDIHFLSPVIPFKQEMGIELLEKGRVRLWTHVEKCTSACQVDYVFNDTILTHGKVGTAYKTKDFVLSAPPRQQRKRV